MWFFMNTCYALTLITVILFALTGLQGYFQFPVFQANHPTFALLFVIVYLFTQTLVIFFFVGTGVSVKEYTLEHHLPDDFHKRSIAIKRRVYPPLMLNLLFMIILFTLVGAVDTYRVPAWSYQLFFVFCLFHYMRIKKVQNGCFRDNTNIILEMSGLKKISV